VSADLSPQVHVFPDPKALSSAAAEAFLALSLEVISSSGRFAVALSGGSTPRRFFTLLASSPYQQSIDWTRIHLFWADERCVPADHPESNFKLLHDTLLAHVPVPEANVHRVHGEADPEQAAREYEREIRSFFINGEMPSFDLIFLGVGEDGHTASLFPGSPSIHEKARIVVPVYLAGPSLNRVTLTLPVINHAAHVIFLATGRSKSDVLHNILKEGNSQAYPAGLVRPEAGTLTWFLDQEAAEKSDGQASSPNALP